MSGRISLALTLHNHQPIGQFGWVFDEVFEHAYEPMVAALERHPAIRIGLHYTGPLLEWLVAHRPAFVARVRALADRKQVELLGGGLYEPVLASIPGRDRIGQLEGLADLVERTFGRRPAGAWLAERVWEPDLPGALAKAGYDWTILDDAHFRAAAVPEDAMWGPYVTDDQGHRLTVFATEQGLRYRIPFLEVDDVIAYLREHATEAGERLGTMGDDGEKFGAWPTTFEHCWGEGRWVDRFFEALEANAEWLTTIRPSDWLATNPPVGRVAIPTGSYAEMGEWALPPDESVAFTEALHHARETGAPEARWLRGAPWRNFQVKYREVNDLHKQMLRVSGKVEAMAPGASRDSARDHLYRGQSNDTYWHGLFGGIYLPDLRVAAYAELIAAEEAADSEAGRLRASETADVDLDGRHEVRLATEGQVVVIDPHEGAGIGSWDLRAARHALAAVLRRRPEAYHETLRRHEREAAEASGEEALFTVDATPGDTPASIHQRVHLKEAGLSELLVYDDYERRSGLVRVLAADATPESWAAGGRGDLSDLVDGPFTVVRLDPDGAQLSRDGTAMIDGFAISLRIDKQVRLGGGRLDPMLELEVSVGNRGEHQLEARLGIEWPTLLLGGGGNPAAWLEVGGLRERHDGSGSAAAIERLAQGNDQLGIAIETRLDLAADAWWAPIETVSNSEAGFERVYQGSALLLSRLVKLAPGARWKASIRHAVVVRTDAKLSEICRQILVEAAGAATDPPEMRQPVACAPRADGRRERRFRR